MTKHYGEHILLDSKAVGVCGKMTGSVEVLAVFVDLPDAPWTDMDIARKRMVVCRALRGLEREAAGYGAQVAFSLTTYRSRADHMLEMGADTANAWIEGVIRATAPTEKTPAPAGKDASWRNAFLGKTPPAARSAGDVYTVKTLPRMESGKEGYGGRPLMMLQNKPGRAWARSNWGSKPEIAFIFQDDSAGVVRHELLHLFGAEDYYHVPVVKEAVKEHLPTSIMLSSRDDNRVDPLTAYLVGWVGELTEEARSVLSKTAHITKADERSARVEDNKRFEKKA